MKEYNGIGLTPIFHSEISSSYMIYDIFDNHKEIVAQLIKYQFNILAENIYVSRECSYNDKGSIDIFIEFTDSGEKCALMIEVKVHDYFSATDGQISTYYNAVVEDGSYRKVYFIYLTQFTEENDFTEITEPKTIIEAKKGKELIKNEFIHISWEQMHSFLAQYYDILTEEQKLIVSLNRQWILYQCRVDLEANKIDVGERGLEDYFFDIKFDIRNVLSFGKEVYENNRQILRIDLSVLDEKQLDIVLDAIKAYTSSNAVNKSKQYKTEDLTLHGAKEFFVNMIQRIEEWKLLSFYSRLFHFAVNESYLKFNGTGSRGFSIKLEIKGKGEISLCTIYRNRIIDFSLTR